MTDVAEHSECMRCVHSDCFLLFSSTWSLKVSCSAGLEAVGPQRRLSVVSQIKRGCYKLLLGDATDAAADFAEASEQFSMSQAMQGCADVPFAQAVMCLLTEDLQAALHHLDKAHAKQPESAYTLTLRGVVKHMLADHAGAVNDLNVAGRSYKKNVMWKMAASFCQLRLYGSAETAFALLRQSQWL